MPGKLLARAPMLRMRQVSHAMSGNTVNLANEINDLVNKLQIEKAKHLLRRANECP